jgi:hypothetical protein
LKGFIPNVRIAGKENALQSCRRPFLLARGIFEGHESYLLIDLQVFETCFTFSTVRVSDLLDPPGAIAELEFSPLLALDREGVPVIWTSWPTCSLNFEVLPSS